MHRLIRNIGWLLTGRGVNAVLSIVYLALATRTLGLDHFGYFAIILALGQTVTGLANFQTWQFVVRWGVGEDGPGDATGFAIALDMLSDWLPYRVYDEGPGLYRNAHSKGFILEVTPLIGADERTGEILGQFFSESLPQGACLQGLRCKD